MKINLSKYYQNKCREFAEAQIKTSKHLYAYRGESNIDKMVEDIVVGKFGECAVYRYLTSRGLACSRPDFKIYAARNKSYDADLTCETVPVHVKSQSVQSMQRYGASWLFQKSDKLLTEPEPKELMAFTSVDGDTVSILGIVRAVDVVDLLGECSVPMYRKTKVALYWDDVKTDLPYYKLRRY